jgi:hypothetical protein
LKENKAHAPSLYWFHLAAFYTFFPERRKKKKKKVGSLIAILVVCSHSKGGALQRNLDLCIPKKGTAQPQS